MMDSKYLIDNPLEIEKFLNKKIHIKANENKSFDGFLKAADPKTGSLILVSFIEDKFKVTIVPGHSIKSFVMSEEFVTEEINVRFNKLFCEEKNTENIKDINVRKAKLISWFKTNKIPVVEKDDLLVIASIVTLKHPYTVKECICPNDIILRRIQDLIERMPDEEK